MDILRVAKLLKSISIFLIITFLNQQFVSANPLIADSINGVLRPVTSQEEVSEDDSLAQPKRDEFTPTTAEFLNQTLALSDGGETAVKDAVRQLDDSQEKRNENYEYTRYTFEDALEQLRPEYASAVIVERLNEADLEKLLALNFEVGIGALKGEIVLFSSGSESDIRVTEAVKNILGELSLMAHTHPLDKHTEGPSQLDREAAGKAIEFVITDSAAYAYSADTKDLSPVEKITHTRFLAELQLALSEERKSIAHIVEARAVLNQLIVEMDLMNATSLNFEIFRASENEFDNEVTLADGTVLRFKQGVLTQVEKVNLSMKNIISDNNGHLQSAVVTFSTGEQLMIVNEALSQITMPDGRVIEVTDGWFSKITDLNGDVVSFTREFDAANLLTSLTVQLGDEPTWGEPELLMSHVSGPLDINELGSNGGVQSYMQQVEFSEIKTLTQIDMKLIKWSNPLGSLEVVVYQDNGGQPGEVVATSRSRQASEFTSYSAYPNYSTLNWESFDFEQVAELQANTKYWISLELADDYASFGDGANVFRVYHNKGGDTLPGLKSGRQVNGSYQNLPSDWDLYFQLYGYVGPDQNPTVLSMNIDADGNVITENSSSVVLSQTAGTMDVNELGSNGGVQSFMQQLNFDTPQIIEQLNFKLTKWFNPVGSIEAVIYEDNGGQPGNLVAKSAPRNASEFTSYSAYPNYNSLDWEGFSFNGVELLANTNYWISVELADDYASFGDGANVFRVYHNKGGDTLPGVKSGRMVNGSYQNLPSDWDLYFQVLGRENTSAPYAIPFNEGYTKTTDALIESTRFGEDLATLLNYAQQYHSEPAPPTISLISTTVTNQASYTLIYEIDGVEVQESKQLVEGANTITVEASNELSRSTRVDFEIVLDTAPPVVEWLSSASVYRADYRLQYRVDGDLIEEQLNLVEGENIIDRNISDVAGNITPITFTVTYMPPFSKNDAIYNTDGFLTGYLSSGTGEELSYSLVNPFDIIFKDALGNIIDQISSSYPQGNFATAIQTSFENGVKAYYENGEIVAIELVDGTWVEDVVFDSEGDVESGVIFYVNGRKDIIRYGRLLRRIETNGLIQDFNMDGLLVREIFDNVPSHYRYAVNSAGEIYRKERVDFDGGSVIYDGFDSLEEIIRSDGSREEFQQNVLYRSVLAGGGQYLYMHNSVSINGVDHKVAILDSQNSAVPENDTPIEINYEMITVNFDDGFTHNYYQIKKVELFDGTTVEYVDGLPVKVTNSVGEIIEYDFREINSLLTGVSVTRNDTELVYDQDGFLSQVVTDQGTITRVLEDKNSDGEITEDEISLLLDEVGGNRLTDFELDANGNILKGIIETKEGVKQYIENGILTGYETVDGKFYEFGDFQADGSRDAYLSEWKFKDGTRVLYGGSSINEILNPDGSRLHTLGFDANHNLKTYIEELADGTLKKFEGINLVELVTPNGTKIFFDQAGMAKEIQQPDGSVLKVAYKNDTDGKLINIIFQGEHTYRTFSAEGELVNLLTKGLRAEIENNQIKKLFTQFGTIESPDFDTDLNLNNEINYADGSKQIIENGQLVKTIKHDGTIINYSNGIIESVQIPVSDTEYAEYQVIYETDAYGLLTNARIRLSSEEGTPEFPLVPFLENPKTLYDVAMGSALPEYDLQFQGNANVINTDAAIGDSSIQFDGDGDYIEVSDVAGDFNFGSNDFTIDFWTQLNSVNSPSGFMTNGALGGSGGWSFHYNGSELVFAMDSIDVITAPWSPISNQWMHVALARSGDLWTIYINGMNIKSTTRSIDVEVSSAPLQLGTARSNSSGAWTSNHRFLNGFLDEVRISNTSRWIENFTPATKKHRWDDQTKFLLPFDQVVEDDSQIVEHAEKLSGVLLGHSLHNTLSNHKNIQSIYSLQEEPLFTFGHTFIQHGTASANTDAALGDSSIQFDGDGDYVEVSDAAGDFNFGSNDFTIDFWTQINSVNSPSGFMTNGALGGSGGWSFHYNGSELVFAMDSIDVITAPWSPISNEWMHVALTRSGDLWAIYINGMNIKAMTRSIEVEVSSAPLQLGTARSNSSGAWTSNHRFLNGFLDEIRISKGIARWTENFTPQTTEYAHDEYTSLLLHFEQNEFDAGAEVVEVALSDSSQESTATVELGKTFVGNGDAFNDFAKYKVGNASVSFDGSGDNLAVDSHSDFDFGSDDWTIDSWVNIAAGAEHITLASKYSDGVGWIIVLSPWNNNVAIYSSGWGGIYIPANFQIGAWQHVAVVREGSQIKLYLDGVLQGAATADATYNGADTPLRIGQYGNSNWFKGRMDEFRISKGIARWTGNFTPQTTEYARDENTSLLLHFEQNEFDAGAEIIESIPEPVEENTAEDIDATEDENLIFFAPFQNDAQRGKSYTFSDDYLPRWTGIDADHIASLNMGFVTRHVTLDVHDHLPARTAELIDMNGDGLPDRVYMDSNAASNFWWVQFNTGMSFEAPVKFHGLINNFIPESAYSTIQKSIRFFEGRHPQILGDLIDLNGDNRPDRVLQDVNGTNEWYIQYNTGTEFEAPVLWTGNLQVTSMWNFQAEFASEVRNDVGNKAIQELVTDLVDMDGDGLLDRVVRPYVAPFTHWFFQRNNGTGFDDTLLWEGVDETFFPSDVSIGASLSWYETSVTSEVADFSGLYDMNGDGKTDRLLLKSSDPNNANAAQNWYIQINNGDGFDPAILWDSSVRVAAGASNNKFATAINVFQDWSYPRNVTTSLKDVTGDGLPDRVTVEQSATNMYSTWWVEKNTGTTFAEAEKWEGIYGSNLNETAIEQDSENFRSNNVGNFSVPGGRYPNSVEKVAELIDLNGDGILDRLIFVENQSEWKVQFGTGKGFLPVTALQIDGLATSTQEIKSSLYDYVHVSLKTAESISAIQGKIVLTMTPSKDTIDFENQIQTWEISDLTTDWQDFYLPIDSAKADGVDFSISFQSVDGQNLNIPISVDNITFTSLRAPATTDWLDRLLTDSDVIAEVHSDQNQTLAEYLGLVDQSDTLSNLSKSFINQLLSAEKRISFDSNQQAAEFEDHYGAVTEISNGAVSQTTLSDGTIVQFSEVDTNNPNQLTQTVIATDGTTQTQTLSYGRVRTVERAGQSDLQYTYEFAPQYSETQYLIRGLSYIISQGAEITVVHDPELGIYEKYAKIDGRDLLMSTRRANGITTIYEYDVHGELIESLITYKGRIQERYLHGDSAEGYHTLLTEDGTTEAYDDQGEIVYHVTKEGYKYQHSFGTAKTVEIVTEQETVTYQDGTTATFDVPSVILSECAANCQEIHRVDLTGFVSPTGESAKYENGELTNLKTYKNVSTQDGAMDIAFGNYAVIDSLNSETQKVDTSLQLLEATVIHEDGTITEFKNGLPYSVTGANGSFILLEPAYLEKATQDPDHAELTSSTESAQFHYAQARKLWLEIITPKFLEFQLKATIVKQSEYDMDGNAVSRAFAEGTREIYDDGRIIAVLDTTGRRMVRYDYDGEGNPTRIEMEASRRNLASSVLEVRANVAVQREQTLAIIAEREQVISHTTEGQYAAVRDRLFVIRNQVLDKRAEISAIQVEGDEARAMINESLSSIDNSLRQIDAALENLATQRANALTQLAQQVADASADFEAQVASTYLEIESQELESQNAIIRQELSSVVHHWYRKILGRDPSEAEFENWVVTANLVTGDFDLESLKQALLTSTEYQTRSTEVQSIKNRVETDLQNYLTMTQSDKETFAAALGISSDKLVSLNVTEINGILNWLLNQSLHFGQSAYLSLEAMLDDASLTYNRVDFATQLILIDILTGTITPAEKGDLILSFYAMRLVATGLGLNLNPLAMNFEGLQAIFNQECPDPIACDFRLVSHINKNHYIVITGVADDEVTYFDPGMGSENSPQVYTLNKAEFMEIWLNSGIANSGFGTVLTPRAPPAEFLNSEIVDGTPSIRSLDESEQMQIRGAFFGFIKKIFKKIVQVALYITFNVLYLVALVSDSVKNFLQTLEKSINHGIDAIFSLAEFDFSGAWQSFKDHLKTSVDLLMQAITLPFAVLAETLIFIGVPEHIALTIADGAKIVVGVIIGVVFSWTGIGAAIGISLITSGLTSIANRYFEMSPTVSLIVNIAASVISTVAGGVGGGASLANILKDVAITAAKEVAVAGITALGNKIGLDPRITGLIGMVASAAVGYVGGKLTGSRTGTYTDSNGNTQTITVSNPYDTGRSFLGTIKDTLFSRDFVGGAVSVGAKSIGLNFGSSGGGGILGTLSSKFVTGAIESTLGQSGLFSNILDVVKNALLSPINAVSGIVNTALTNVKGFTELIQEKGLGSAFESIATAVFNRQTIERLLGQTGGLAGAVESVAKVVTSLNGQSVLEQDLGGGTSLFYNLAGAFIGKKENGVTQLGTFGQTQLGKWGLLAGSLIANLSGGLVFAAEVQNGQFYGGNITDINGARIFEFKPENGSGPIIIDGSQEDNDKSGVSFWNILIRFLPMITDLIISEGELKSVEVDLGKTQVSTTATSSTSVKPFYLLSNGINNEANHLFATADNQIAKYYRDGLKPDLQEKSNYQVTPDEILTPSTYWNWFLLRLLGKIGNRGKDVIWFIAESQVPGHRLGIVNKIETEINNFYNKRKEAGEDATSRPIVGVGYSGGFAPLLEAINRSNVPTAAIIGAGGALSDITQVRDALELLGNALEYVQRSALEPVSGLFEKFFSLIPVIGDSIAHMIDVFFNKLALVMSPTAVLTDVVWKGIEEAVALTLEETGIQTKLTNLSNIGLANINSADATLVNVYGDMDVLNTLNVGGYRDQIGNFVGDKLINIEVMSLKDPVTGKIIGKADHYIYFGETRDYDKEFEYAAMTAEKRAELRAFQMEYDEQVNDFMAQLILAGDDNEKLQSYITKLVGEQKLKLVGGNKYEFYPFGY